MTRARNERESASQFEALQELSRLGLPVFIADARSIPEFVRKVEPLPGVQLQIEGENLVQQVKRSIARAIGAGHDLIFYTEPDKKEFFQRSARDYLTEAIQARSAICIAARDEPSFASFPKGQQWTETAFNNLASSLLGPLPDQLYGPLILDATTVHEFIEQAPEQLGWGWRPYVITRAVRAQHRITQFIGPFCCPSDQREEDDENARIYRLQQLSQNIEGLRLGLQHSLAAGLSTV
jgi:hypothetical protein